MNPALQIAAIATASLCSCALASDPVSLIARCAIPADAHDRSGLTGSVGSVPSDRLGGMGSAIAWTGRAWEFIMLPDRGPADGAAPYRARFHLVRFTPDLERRELGWEVLRTVMLTDEAGVPLHGLSSAIDTADRSRSHRFDPEGARLGADGTLYIAEEYGPRIDAFGPDGKRVRHFAVPCSFSVEHESGDPEEEMPPRNTRGRQPNRGFEGLALAPDQKSLWAILQSPLIQDGALDEKGKRVGVNIRVLEIDVTPSVPDRAPRQFVYPLSGPRLGVSEMLAVDDHRMLVIERDGEAGALAKKKLVCLADFAGATDVSDVAALPRGDLPPEIHGAAKRVFIDLLDPAFGLAGESFPEKVEGLAFGPDLPDGRRTLIVTTDNDFKDDAPSWVWVFAFGNDALAR